MSGAGLCLPQLGDHVDADVVFGFCREAERLDYTSLWVQDHFLWPLEPARGYAGVPGLPIPTNYQSVLAPTELLAAAAAVTTTPLLGTSILVQGNHWPAPLAQQLATIDQLSRGRLVVGIGQGWNAEEHVASGTSVTERAARMGEFISVLKACWGPDPVEHRGRFFAIPPSMQRPKPHQRPRPLLISGASSPAGRARTAELFDGWNPAGQPVDAVAAQVAEMNAMRRADQPPLKVYFRTFVQFLEPAAPTDAIVERLREEATAAKRAGFDEYIIEANFWDAITSPDDWLDVPRRFEPVLEAWRSTEAGGT